MRRKRTILTLAVVLFALPPAQATESLEEFARRFPPREANRSAETLISLARELGIDLLPRHRRNAARAASEITGRHRAIRGDVGAYVQRELEREESVVELPPESVVSFLRDREEAIGAVREHLIRAEAPAWERDLAKLDGAPVPNLLGVVDLHKLLIADALQAIATHDPRSAGEDLEASWSLNAWLRREPILIDQAIAIAVARFQAGLLRRMDPAPPGWAGRLREHDYSESLRKALLFEAAMLERLDDRPDAPAPSGFWSRWARRLQGPYVRWCLRQTAEEIREAARTAARSPEPCASGVSPDEAAIERAARFWNVTWTLYESAVGSLPRSRRLDFDLELTVKLLDVRETKRRTGAWPNATPGFEVSSVCSDIQWLYRVELDGSMTLGADRKPEWPRATGIVLPTRFRQSRLPAEIPAP